MTHTFKPKNSCPPIQTIDPAKQYVITINGPQYLEKGITRPTYCLDYIRRMLHGVHYKLHMEISDLGRLHWHGWIVIHDRQLFYLKILPKLLQKNTVVIDTIDLSDDHWYHYCTKQSKYIEDVLGVPVHTCHSHTQFEVKRGEQYKCKDGCKICPADLPLKPVV